MKTFTDTEYQLAFPRSWSGFNHLAALDKAIEIVSENPWDERGCTHPAYRRILTLAKATNNSGVAWEVLTNIRWDLTNTQLHHGVLVVRTPRTMFVRTLGPSNVWTGVEQEIADYTSKRDHITYVWDGTTWSYPRRGSHLRSVVHQIVVAANEERRRTR